MASLMEESLPQTDSSSTAATAAATATSAATSADAVSVASTTASPSSPSAASVSSAASLSLQVGGSSGSRSAAGTEGSAPTPAKVWTCHCGKEFSNSTRYHKHARLHSDEKPFQCTHPGCDKAFKRKTHLTRHLITHSTTRPFGCAVPGCQKHFATKQKLAKHERSHMWFSCEICCRSFRTQEELVNHQKVHSDTANAEGETTWSCPDCRIQFADSASLQRHRKRHQLHKCTECEKSFTRFGDLVAHRKQDHPKSFVCEDCGKVYRRNVALVEHKKRVHQEQSLVCKAAGCGQVFSSKSSLHNHHRVVHEGHRPFSCKLCGMIFAYRHVLTRHYQCIHPGGSSPKEGAPLPAPDSTQAGQEAAATSASPSKRFAIADDADEEMPLMPLMPLMPSMPRDRQTFALPPSFCRGAFGGRCDEDCCRPVAASSSKAEKLAARAARAEAKASGLVAKRKSGSKDEQSALQDLLAPRQAKRTRGRGQSDPITATSAATAATTSNTTDATIGSSSSSSSPLDFAQEKLSQMQANTAVRPAVFDDTNDFLKAESTEVLRPDDAGIRPFRKLRSCPKILEERRSRLELLSEPLFEGPEGVGGSMNDSMSLEHFQLFGL